MKSEQAIDAFAALASQTRLDLLRALVRAGPEGLLAGAVAEAIGATPSRASFHLKTLTEAGLITAERQSRQIIYRADYARIGALMAFLVEDCCGGNATVRQCCAPGAC
ncbi:ArsR/SmtB family transcription factor [Shimia biformata]|uniref:ArsR/SmtB family transcription factor n=1 Tax=Shimia biformata TaxID=1294299 RepID=UPI00194F7004|nr:metalloregulator ArsR/SmtB family transcription factor [Shimia biformata]